MALTQQQLTGLNAAAARRAAGSANATDLKNLEYAEKSLGYKYQAPTPEPIRPPVPQASTSPATAGPVSEPAKPPTSQMTSPSAIKMPPIQNTVPQTQLATPVRPPSAPAPLYIPPGTESFLVNAASMATPREGYQVVLPGTPGEFYNDYNELVGGYNIRFAKPVTRDYYVDSKGVRQSVRTNEDLPDVQNALGAGFRVERAPGVPITPFDTQQIQTGAKTGVTSGAISLAAPSGAFEQFLSKQGKSQAEISTLVQGLNAAAMRQATGKANATDLANLAYAESRGYTRPQVSQQAQVEAISRINTPAPTVPVDTPPPVSAAPTAPAAAPDTLPAGSFGESAAIPRPPDAAQSTQLSNAITQQEKALKDLMDAMTEAETTTPNQQALLDLQKQIQDQELATQMGIANVQDQPIASPFLQGQSAAIQRQAGIRQQGIANQAAYLQSLVANEQAARQRKLQNAQARYETASGLVQNYQKQFSPIEVGGSLVRLNPTTGKYEQIYTSPKASETKELNGVLYERQADGSWKKVAGDSKPSGLEVRSVGDLLYERQSDGTWKQVAGTQKQKEPDVRVVDGQLVERDPVTGQWKASYGQPASTSKPPTADESKAAGYLIRMQDASKIFDELAPKVTAMTPAQFFLERNLPNALKSDVVQRQEQAERNFINAVLRRESGAAISDAEFDNARKQYFPQAGDSVAVLEQKKQNRSSAMRGMELSAGNAASAANKDSLDAALDAVGFKQDLGTSVNGHDVNKFVQAIGQFETGGNYKALGVVTKSGDRAYGKYQVMGNNIPQWTKEVLGKALTPQQFLNSPEAQDKVAVAKLGAYLKQYGTIEDASSLWFSGRPMAKAGNAKDALGTSVPQYISAVRSIYQRSLT